MHDAALCPDGEQDGLEVSQNDPGGCALFDVSAMIAVIGCGNLNRRDDGAGCQVVRALAALDLVNDPSLRLLDAGTDGIAVMFAARGCQTLIVVDACRSDSEPGSVFEVPGIQLEQRYQPALNLHDFRWDHALFAGRKILRDSFPTEVVVLLIEVETTEYGIGLSPRVQAAVDKVVERVAALIRSHAPADLTQNPASVVVTRGSVYLTRELCESYFANLEAVILLRRDNDLLIMPVRHGAAGGYLLKLQNGAGDRVVNAGDFFRLNGIDDAVELHLPAFWSTQRAGLLVEHAFDM
jgi:hydrogenase maturation protease